LLSEWGGEAADVFSYKRAQVAYAVLKNPQDMINFIAYVRTARPTTKTTDDDGVMWAKVSQPPELRAKTLPLRAAARSIYAHFENKDLPHPVDMVVDYHRNEIVVENHVIVSVKGMGDVTWHEDVWTRRLPNAPLAEIRAAAAAFAAPRE
jgi:hypothetical protein